MRATDIIGKLAKDRVVEKQLQSMSACKSEKEEDLQDLAQEIYLILLEKDGNLIESMYKRDEMNYYISAIITNQVLSNTSPYRTKYTKNNAAQLTEDTIGVCPTGGYMDFGFPAYDSLEESGMEP